MHKHFYILFLLILSSKIYCLNIHRLCGSSMKICQVKFHDQDWMEADDCDKPSSSFDTSWSGAEISSNNLFIDYKLGEKVNIYVKVFNNVPLTSYFWDY